MHLSKPLQHALSALALSALSAPAFAATVYTSSAAFLAQVAPGSYTQTFTGLADPVGASPYATSGGGFAYSASAPSGLYLSGGFLSTNQIDQALTITFTSGNVKAFGGNFYTSDIGDAFQSFVVTLTLSDGTVATFLPTTFADTYRGFTSSVAISSVVFSAPGQSLYASIDNFTVGTVAVPVPEPTSLLLMGAGVAGLLAGVRRRRAAAC